MKSLIKWLWLDYVKARFLEIFETHGSNYGIRMLNTNIMHVEGFGYLGLSVDS